MIGIVVITHGNFGEGILQSAKQIMKGGENCLAINLSGRRDLNELSEEIKNKVSALDSAEGILICIDAMGGTPYNATRCLTKEGSIHVVTGVNLPMLLSALNNRSRMNIQDLARKVVEDGRKTMVVALDPRLTGPKT